ncbi:acetolactate synthase small subunit [candidate division KSB1 bacterium]|nr:acetolactate synthase small subunit [candidate division KSB1 bacterium]
MRHIINLEVENNAGVLARIAGLFSARGFNIEALSVGQADPNATARMTLVVRGNDEVIEQINKQLNKLIDVIRVTDVTKNYYVSRDLVLVKVTATPTKRNDISQLINIFGAKVVDISNKTMILELGSSEAKVNAFIETLRPFGIKEIARSGTISMLRDSSGTF